MKKVLFTLVDLKIGGVQKTLVSILNNFDYSKHQVDIMLLKKESNELIKLLPKEVNILYLNDYIDISMKNNLFNRINKNIKIKSILKLYQNKIPLVYDYAIAFNGFNNYADLIAASVKAKKKIIWVHNDFYNVIKYSKIRFLYNVMYKLMGKKFAYFDNIVVVCEGIENSFNILYKYKYKDKIKVIYNYIDTNEIIEKSKEKVELFNKDTFNIVSVGRICKAKNFNLLVTLHEKLIANNYKVNTYIVGSGEGIKKLEELITSKNITDSFKLLGNKINPYPYIKQADLFVSTSLYESYANTIIESLILGISTIATNTTGAINIKDNIAISNTCMIGNNLLELYDLVVKQINSKNKNQILDYEKINKKVMLALYDLLS